MSRAMPRVSCRKPGIPLKSSFAKQSSVCCNKNENKKLWNKSKRKSPPSNRNKKHPPLAMGMAHLQNCLTHPEKGRGFTIRTVRRHVRLPVLLVHRWILSLSHPRSTLSHQYAITGTSLHRDVDYNRNTPQQHSTKVHVGVPRPPFRATDRLIYQSSAQLQHRCKPL